MARRKDAPIGMRALTQSIINRSFGPLSMACVANHKLPGSELPDFITLACLFDPWPLRLAHRHLSIHPSIYRPSVTRAGMLDGSRAFTLHLNPTHPSIAIQIVQQACTSPRSDSNLHYPTTCIICHGLFAARNSRALMGA